MLTDRIEFLAASGRGKWYRLADEPLEDVKYFHCLCSYDDGKCYGRTTSFWGNPRDLKLESSVENGYVVSGQKPSHSVCLGRGEGRSEIIPDPLRE